MNLHSLIRVFVVRRSFVSLAVQNAPRENSDQTAVNTQADLNLRRAHMSAGMFSDIAAHIMKDVLFLE